MQIRVGRRGAQRLRIALLACSVPALFGRPPTGPTERACPPSCANNELIQLLDTFCSDKGTFWQSKHHYGTAYHALFGSLRDSVSSILEIGIGEDTAPSVQAWATYFPNAHVYPIDIKTRREVADRARPGGATDRLIKHQAQFGCDYNRSMWDNPRVHLTLETDASDPEQLGRVALPPQLDIILDDGSHRYLDQQRTLHTLWPRLRPGGFYIVEDMLVGALPWDKEHAKQVPSSNADCGLECFFPQRLAEHPFLFDRFGHLKGNLRPAVPLEPRTQDLMRHSDWFWVVTGVHQGGGLDCSLIIRKSGPPIRPQPLLAPRGRSEPTVASTNGLQPAASVCAAGCVEESLVTEAHRSLQSAQAMQSKLLTQQAELTAQLAQLRQLQAEPAYGAIATAREARCSRSDWPLAALLAVSLVTNLALWRRRSSTR